MALSLLLVSILLNCSLPGSMLVLLNKFCIKLSILLKGEREKERKGVEMNRIKRGGG